MENQNKKTWLVLLVPRNNNGNSDFIQVDLVEIVRWTCKLEQKLKC